MTHSISQWPWKVGTSEETKVSSQLLQNCLVGDTAWLKIHRPASVAFLFMAGEFLPCPEGFLNRAVSVWVCVHVCMRVHTYIHCVYVCVYRMRRIPGECGEEEPWNAWPFFTSRPRCCLCPACLCPGGTFCLLICLYVYITRVLFLKYLLYFEWNGC